MTQVPLAVVGMACRLPGASDTAALWQNVLRDVCAIRPLPGDRFHRARYYDPEIGAYGKSYSAIGGLVADDRFDPTGLGLEGEDLSAIDRAHVWALDVARSTVRDSGLDPGSLARRNTGVIIGHARGSMLSSDLAFGCAVEGLVEAATAVPELGHISPQERLRIGREAVARLRQRHPTRGAADLASTMAASLASRIAHAFDLSGRAYVVDAACASSFAALDVAARALGEGRLDAAIVGGASYSQELSVVLFAQSRALSPDGSFPFDERANGFISSDGVAFFLVTRLEDALRAGLRIRAVIRGVGGACDGKGKALWAPRKEGQVLAMRRAYEGSGVDPASIELYEAHATSTPIGDATEIGAVEEVFGAALRGSGRKLPVGSIKGNIGHTRETAGAAGLVKVIAAMEAGVLPPTGGLVTPSRTIPWGDVVAAPQREAAPWNTGKLRRAGVSAFGIGGLDFHVVVEEPPPETRVFAVSGAPSPAARAELPANAVTPRGLDVAIVGLGTRLPGAAEPAALWSRIVEDRSAIGEAPIDRWNKAIFEDRGPATPYRTYTTRGAFLEGFKADWRRYRVPPKLVDSNDPLQFMLLESASDALEDAGIDLVRIDRARVATIMGTTFGSDYALDLSLAIRAPELAEVVAEVAGRTGERSLEDAVVSAIRRDLPTIDEDSSGSFSSSTLASRIAKTLDLMGPTYTIDAACGASMASLEAACEALVSRESDLVIAGGGDRAMRVQRYATYCAAGVMSRRGQPAPFEDDADGLVPGEGAVVWVLERLEDALANGRKVYGVIRGVGSASAGREGTLASPSSTGLSRAIQRALDGAQVDAADVVAVEGHGTGVPAYDRAEREALKVYAPDVALDSVKRLYGHGAGAAGATAIAKVALARAAGTWPLHGPRAAVPVAFEDDALAGVSSLAFTGVAHHALIAAAPAEARRRKAAGPGSERPTVGPGANATAKPNPSAGPERSAARAEPPHPSQEPAPPARGGSSHGLVPRSAVLIARGATPRAVVADLRARPDEALSSRQLGRGPSAIALVAGDREELDAKLALLSRTVDARPLLRKQGVFVRSGLPKSARVALCFSGQGSQYGGMLGALIERIPECAEVVARADRWCSGRGLPLASLVIAGREIPDDVFWVQASVLVADLVAHVAITTLGVVPDVVTGHSFGDYAALVAAGAWSLESALDATRIRSRGIEAAVEPGAMISAAAGRREVEAALAEVQGRGVVVPSNLNAPRQTVVSGSPGAIDAAIAALASRGIEARRLSVPRAFHSPLMAGAQRALHDGLASVELRAPRVPYLSSVSGRIESEPSQIRASLVEQLVRPVDFVAQIELLVREGVGLFIECGPKAVLTGLVEEIVAGRELDAVPTDDASRPGSWALERVRAAVELRRADAALDVVVVEDAPHASLVPLPREGGLSSSREDALSWPREDALSWPREDALVLLEGEEARTLSERPGFDAFWSRSRPAVVELVRGLWSAEEAVHQAAAEEAARAAEAAARAAAASAPVLSAAPAMALPSREEIRGFLVTALASHTGYPEELIDPAADLEADLGIDTVKQAQVLGKVRDRYQLRTEGSVSLADFPTVDKIVAYVTDRLEKRALAPARPARPRAPVVDVTARRSGRPALASGATLAPPASTTPHRALAAPQDAAVTVRAPALAPSAPQTIPSSTAVTAPQAPATAPAAGPSAPPPPWSAEPIRAPETAPAADVTPVLVLHLHGTAREIGRQHGEQAREQIRTTLDRYERFLGDQRLSALAVPEATRVLPAFFDADTLEELRGIAEGAGVPLEHLLAYNLDAALFPALAPGCTQVVRTARANGGTLLHGVNEDSPLLVHLGGSAPRVVQLRRRTDTPGPARTTIGFSLAGQVAGPNAVSDLGLTITSCTLLDGPPPRGLPEGLPHPQLVKRMIERAATLDEAIDIALAAERAGRWSLLVSSASEDRAVFLEYDGREVLHRREVDGVLVTTNHSIERSADDARVPAHSRHRETRARALMAGQQPRDVGEIGRALRDRWDVARDREVKHPTMNTVRRVDNVMSLVVEPSALRLYVTDRVEAPAHEGGSNFLTLDYGRATAAPKSTPTPLPAAPLHARKVLIPPHAPASSAADASMDVSVSRSPAFTRVDRLGHDGSGVVHVDEVMRRSVVRVVLEPSAPAVAHGRTWRPDTALVVGRGPTAEAIVRALLARGAEVEACATVEQALARIAARSFEALGLVLDAAPPEAPWIGESAWKTRRAAALTEPFALVRAWLPSAPPEPTLFAITRLGGALGFDNLAQGTPEHAGVVGLVKALRREHEGLTAQVLDTGADAPAEEVTVALLAELDAGSPTAEVGLFRGRRARLTMPLVAADDFRAGAERLPRAWILTGGARGITAAVAERLATLYRPRLHLIGRQPLPADARPLEGAELEAHKKARYAALKAERPQLTALEWGEEAAAIDKTAEIARNLAALAALGSQVHYHAVDVADPEALAATLDVIRATGPIEGLIHGAGVEIAKPLAKKTDAIFEATVASKVDGLAHLLRLTAGDPLTHVVGFSSVSGRFGGHGQADYALANEAMSRLLGAYRMHRTNVRAAAIAWPAWSEVGLASRSSAKAFLEQSGQRFLSPAEGANHLVRELWCGLPEAEVTISDGLPALDLDHLMVRDDGVAGWRARAAEVARTPLLGRLILDSSAGDGRCTTERRLSAHEPFLAQHLMGTTPILPGVIGLEALCELAGLESERFTAGEVVIQQPLKLSDTADVRLSRSGDQLALTMTTRRPDGIVLVPDRAYFTGKRVPRRPLPVRSAPRWPVEDEGRALTYPYPRSPDATPGSRVIFHGPVFRGLELVVPTGPDRGLARLVVPPVEALVARGPERGSPERGTASTWRLPAALLDGCLQATGLLARALFETYALPAGFGRIDVAPRAVLASGETVIAEIVMRQERDDLVADILVWSAGEPLLFLEGYRARGPRSS